MQGLITLLGSVSAGTVLGWIVAIVLAAVTVYKWAQKYRKTRNEYEETKQETKDNSDAIKTLQQTSEQNKKIYKEHFDALEDRDKKIISKIEDVNESIKGLQVGQQKLSDYQKSKDIADLKDRIQHAYKTYMQRAKINNGLPFITQNEEEILKGLITAYEDAGGNSFIHSKVIPAMADWEVIDQKQFMKRMNGAAHD